MAVAAAGMLSILVGIVVMTAVAEAGYNHSPSSSVGLAPLPPIHYETSNSQPYASSSAASYGSGHSIQYPVASQSAPIVTSQSAQYSRVPLPNTASYVQSATPAVGYPDLPTSQNNLYPSRQSSYLQSAQSILYAPSHSKPLQSAQSTSISTAHYGSIQSVPATIAHMPLSSQISSLPSDQTINYASSLSPSLSSIANVNYGSSQSAPLQSSQNLGFASSQNAPWSSVPNDPQPSSQGINYALIPSSRSPIQTSYAATQSGPYSSSQNSYSASQNRPYTVSQATHSTSSAGASNYEAPVVTHAGQLASTTTVQNTPSITSGQTGYGKYNYQSGFSPIVTQQGPNYQIVHHSSASESGHQSNSHREDFITAQTVTHQSDGINFDQTYSSGYVDKEPLHASLPPIISKHIYFHVPPPEVEESLLQTVPSAPPKKVYNIVFIKVPSQESKNNLKLQSLLSGSQKHRIEDKTLIYVLVKKPDPQPEPRPLLPPTRSEHEVFYVKYKGSPNEVASQINSKLSQQTSLQSDVQAAIEPVLQATGIGSQQPLLQQSIPVLQPGLVNGNY